MRETKWEHFMIKIQHSSLNLLFSTESCSRHDSELREKHLKNVFSTPFPWAGCLATFVSWFISHFPTILHTWVLNLSLLFVVFLASDNCPKSIICFHQKQFPSISLSYSSPSSALPPGACSKASQRRIHPGAMPWGGEQRHIRRGALWGSALVRGTYMFPGVTVKIPLPFCKSK